MAGYLAAVDFVEINTALLVVGAVLAGVRAAVAFWQRSRGK